MIGPLECCEGRHGRRPDTEFGVYREQGSHDYDIQGRMSIARHRTCTRDADFSMAFGSLGETHVCNYHTTINAMMIEKEIRIHLAWINHCISLIMKMPMS